MLFALLDKAPKPRHWQRAGRCLILAATAALIGIGHHHPAVIAFAMLNWFFDCALWVLSAERASDELAFSDDLAQAQKRARQMERVATGKLYSGPHEPSYLQRVPPK